MRASIYISGALIAAKDLAAARVKYEACAEILERAGFEPYLPHQATDPERMASRAAGDVFAQDIRALLGANLVVSFLDEPSHGVGAELAICVSRNIPVIALVQQGIRISRFIEGMLRESGMSVIVSYESAADLWPRLPELVTKALRRKVSDNSDAEFRSLLKRA